MDPTQPPTPPATPAGPSQHPARPRGRRPRIFPPPARGGPDPGSRKGAVIGGIAAALLIGLVALLQQLSTSAAAEAVGQPPGAPGSPIIQPSPAEFEITAKVSTKLYHVMPSPDLGRQIVGQLRTQDLGPVERVRAATVEADLIGPEAALAELAEVERTLDPETPLREDIRTLRALYQSEDRAAALPSDIDALIDRHGWFGRLAATHGLDPDDPVREAVVGGGTALTFVLLGLALAVVGAMITGIVLLVVGVSMASSGRLRRHFVPPSPGGSVAIETVAVFVGGFALLKLGTGVLSGLLPPDRQGAVMLTALLGQWLLIGALFWPVVRGVGARAALGLWGLHRGAGVLREIGWGIVGYVACLPILLCGILITLGLVFLEQVIRFVAGAGERDMPQNPVIDMVFGSSDPWKIVLFFLLASLWAPLVEEAVFRGALYRHLRSRWAWPLAAVVTALAFGFMHGYPVLLLGPVISLGFGFALLREWRGSIISSMTAHCIHNAGVLMILLTVLGLIGD